MFGCSGHDIESNTATWARHDWQLKLAMRPVLKVSQQVTPSKIELGAQKRGPPNRAPQNWCVCRFHVKLHKSLDAFLDVQPARICSDGLRKGGCCQPEKPENFSRPLEIPYGRKTAAAVVTSSG